MTTSSDAPPSLLVVAHGSLRNPDSSTPCWAHAARLRDLGVFARVEVAFWREQPALWRAAERVPEGPVIVVPLFMADGYFTRRVVPRELGLADPDVKARMHVAAPVGTHPSLPERLIETAAHVTGRATLEQTAALIIGHGTTRSATSSEAVWAQVRALRASRRFARVEAAFLDQSPTLPEALDAIDTPALVALPFFIADGYHTRDQIPALLGLDAPPDAALPVYGRVGARAIWCASAIGAQPGITGVIWERAREVWPALGAMPRALRRASPHPQRAIAARIAARGRWGQLALVRDAEGTSLRHIDDRHRPARDLEALPAHPDALRRATRAPSRASWRPLPTRRDLPTGWRTAPAAPDNLPALLDAVYPGHLAEQEAWQARGADARTPLGAFLARQRGAYAALAELSPERAEAHAARFCASCVCARVWGAQAPNARAASAPDAPLCLGPCGAWMTDAAKDPTPR